MSGAAGQIGPGLATAIVAGNMIGSGVYLLPAVLAKTGSASLIAWGVAALFAVVLALVYAFLGALRDGSETLTDYPGTAFHPVAGFVAWAAYWAGCVVGNVAILVVAAGYGAATVGIELAAGERLAVLLMLIWGLAACALAGPRFVGRLSSATLLMGLLPIAAAILIGLAGFDAAVFSAAWNVTGAPLAEALPPTLLTIFWAFLGLESANAIARRVRHPKRNIAIAAAGGVAIAAVVYALATAALFGLVPAGQLAASSAPFADVIGGVAGSLAGQAVAAAACLRTIGCTAGWILVTAETGQAGARRGFLPRALSSGGEGAPPARDIVFTAALMSGVALMTLTPDLVAQFTRISDFSVYAFLMIYALGSLALVRFASGFGGRWLRLGASAAGVIGAAASVWIAWAALAG